MDEAVADDLNLRLVGDGFEIRVQDRALCVESLSVAVAGSRGIEEVVEMELLGGCQSGLVLDEDDLMVVKCVADDIEVFFGDIGKVDVAQFSAKVDLGIR